MSFGGFGGFMGPDIGSGLVRVAADYSGLRQGARVAAAQMRAELQQGFKGVGAGSQQMRGLNDQLDGAVKRTNRLSTALKGLTLGLGLAAVTGFGMAVKSAIQFESAFAGVEKTVDASRETLDRLRREIIEMSKSMPVAATELARIGESAGALGVPTESITKFIKVVSTIGTTTDVSVDEAATALGQLSNILDLTTADYERFASTLVDLGNKGASTEKQILEIARRYGGSAKQFGIDAKNVLALASAAANIGMQPELAGSTLARLTDRLVSISGSLDLIDKLAGKAGISTDRFVAIAGKGGTEANKLADGLGYTAKQLKGLVTGSASLEALERGIGLSHEQFAKLRDTHPEQIIARLFQAMKDMPGADRMLFMQSILGPAASAGGGAGMQRLVNGLSESVNKNLIPSLDNARNAWRSASAAEEEAAKRYKTTSSQWQLLQNQLNAIAIEAGTSFLPTLQEITTFLADSLPKALRAIGDLWNAHLREPMDRVIAAGAGLLDVLGRILLDWGPGGAGGTATNAFETMASAAGSLVNHLSSLLDILRQLLSNPIINALAKVGVIFAAMAGAARIFRSIRGMVGGLGNAALGMLSFGRLGGTAGAIDPSAVQQTKAASMQMAAAEMQLKAAVGGRASAAGMAMAEQMALGHAAGAYRNQPGSIVYAGGSNFATGKYGAMSFAASPYQRGMSALGAGMVGQAMGQFWTGAKGAVRAGARGLGSLASGALGLVSRAFWPLLIADLAGSLVQQPIADFVRQNTGMKRVADAWARSWLEGIGASFEAVARGSDAFVGRPTSYTIGGTNVDTAAMRIIADKLGDDEGARAVMDAVDAAETPIEALAALARMADFINTNRTALQNTINVDPAEWVLAGLDNLLGNREEAIDRLNASVGKYDELSDMTHTLVMRAMQELVTAIQNGAREAGIELQGYQLHQLDLRGLTRIGNIMTASLPENLGFLRQWVAAQEIQGLDARKYTKPEDIAGGAKGITESADALGRWRTEQQKTFGPSAWTDLNKFVRAYDQIFGTGGTADNMSDKERLRALRRTDLFDEELRGISAKDGISKDEKRRIDQYWEAFAAYYASAASAVGLDQEETIANATRDLIAGGLESGMTFREIAKNLPWDALYDGIGDAQSDASQRIGAAVRSVIQEAMSDAVDPKTQNTAIAMWNKIWEGIPGMQVTGKGGKGFGQLTNMVAATLATDVMGAGDAESQNAVLDAFNKMMPKGSKLSSFEALKDLVGTEDVQAIAAQIQSIGEQGLSGGLSAAAQQTAGMVDGIIKPIWDAVSNSQPSSLQAPLPPAVAELAGLGQFMADTIFQGMTRQWAQRMAGFSLPPPGANPPPPVGGQAPSMPGSAGSVSRSTTINIGNVTALGPVDEQSAVAQIGFMSATA